MVKVSPPFEGGKSVSLINYNIPLRLTTIASPGEFMNRIIAHLS